MECKESAEIKRDTITLLSWFIALLQCLLNKTININLSPESCAEKGGEVQHNGVTQ